MKLEDFVFIQELGTGGTSVVNLVIHSDSGKRYALKKIKDRYIKNYKLAKEIAIQKSLKHPNTVKLIDYFWDGGYAYLVLEECIGDLYELKGQYSPQCVLKDVIHGLIYLHSMRIVHRDIKLENLFATYSGRIKIGDYGWAMNLKEGQTTNTTCGTLEYCAPEQLKGEDYDFSVDLWALGVLTYELIENSTPFWNVNESIIRCKIKDCDYKFTDSFDDVSKDFISKLLVLDPKKRNTLDKCLTHPYLSDYTHSPTKLSEGSNSPFHVEN